MKKIYSIQAILLLLVSFSSVIHAGLNKEQAELAGDNQAEVDVRRKSKECRQLTANAAKYFASNSLEVACNDFVHKAVWRKGELFPFVIREDGVVLAHGDDTDLIWKDITSVKGIGGNPLIKEMLAVQGNRSISYLWDNAYKASYVTVVTKNNKRYVIGSGFYPENNAYTTKQIVSSAVSVFTRDGKEAAFALISNPNGPFVKGDIYAFAYDFNGVCVAHGSNAALVGQNLIDMVDSRGKHLIQELIRVAKEKGKGWVSYEWRNAPKRSYVERVIDPKTQKPYLISAGYHPNINLSTLQTYINRAIKFLKAEGAKEALAEFSNQVGEFAYGSLGVFVYNFEGKCLANGINPGFVGQNLIKQKDANGRFYVKEMIDVARKYGKGTVSFVDSNAYTIAYVEAVDIPDGKFVIGSQYHPASKVQSTRALVVSALQALRDMPTAQAFTEFTSRKGQYFRGDLYVFVYDTKGTRLVHGAQTGQIWHNFMRNIDQEGKSVVGDIISRGINGGGWIEYQVRNAIRRVYAKAVEVTSKEGEAATYIVGSGYFL